MSAALLKDAYLHALSIVKPENVVRRWFAESGSFDASAVIAIGKCAAGMIEGLPSSLRDNVFAAIPRGYPKPAHALELFTTGHPLPDDESLDAGSALLKFAARNRGRVLLLLSGGSSACVDAFDPNLLDRETYFELMTRLHRSGLPIDRLNAARASVSLIKGGGLGRALPDGSLALICSDVDPDTPHVVGSGPTFEMSTSELALEVLDDLNWEEAFALANRIRARRPHEQPSRVTNIVVADNLKLLGAAAASLTKGGMRALIHPRQIEGDVTDAARTLFRLLPEQPVAMVAGGEPTVKLRGNGVGGRCSELVLHLSTIMSSEGRGGTILVGSSDGVDGSSPAAGFVIEGALPLKNASQAEIRDALDRSDSYPLAARLAEPIMMPATGNNLRDIYLLARA